MKLGPPLPEKQGLEIGGRCWKIAKLGTKSSQEKLEALGLQHLIVPNRKRS